MTDFERIIFGQVKKSDRWIIVSWIAVGIMALVGIVSLGIVGCTSKPDQAAQDVAEESSAAAIDAHSDDEPVVDETPVEPRCGCCDGCICSKERCLCATGEKCCEACKCHVRNAWFYCPDCKNWDRYSAPERQTKTQCSKCKQKHSYWVTDEEAQRWSNARAKEQRLNAFKSAMTRSVSSGGC